VFDIGRLCALVWALTAALRARRPIEVCALACVAYWLGLELTSGFTVRSDGPMMPMVALLLVILGPSAMPRGRLPSLPMAGLAVHRAAAVDGLACVLLLALAWSTSRRAGRLPELAPGRARILGVASSVTLLAVFEGIFALARLLPNLLGDDLGTGHVEGF
jgi:hypothetical protein